VIRTSIGAIGLLRQVGDNSSIDVLYIHHYFTVIC